MRCDQASGGRPGHVVRRSRCRRGLQVARSSTTQSARSPGASVPRSCDRPQERGGVGRRHRRGASARRRRAARRCCGPRPPCRGRSRPACRRRRRRRRPRRGSAGPAARSPCRPRRRDGIASVTSIIRSCGRARSAMRSAGVVDMEAVDDQPAIDALVVERGADHARRAVQQRRHRVEQMRDAGDPGGDRRARSSRRSRRYGRR